MAQDSDTDRPIGEMPGTPDLVDEPRGVACRRPADHAEPAALRDRGRELGGGVAAAHGRVDDRMGDAEQVADASVDRQCGVGHRPILGDAAAVVRADGRGRRSAAGRARCVRICVRVCRNVQVPRRAPPSCASELVRQCRQCLVQPLSGCRKGGVSRERELERDQGHASHDRRARGSAGFGPVAGCPSGAIRTMRQQLSVAPIERSDAERSLAQAPVSHEVGGRPGSSWR